MSPIDDIKLTPQMLINAYCQGIFPMAHDDGYIYWYDPDPRAILPLDKFHVAHSLARLVRQKKFEIRVDTAFKDVMRACAEPGPGRETTWINEEIINLYTSLYRSGFAHSVESWQDNKLVGGLYGIAVRGLFAGESMFSRERDASKVALVHLVNRLVQGNFQLLDVQFQTDHLKQFGAIEIPRKQYKGRLIKALTVLTTF